MIAFRNTTASRTTARTANHYLKAVRMVFLARRRDNLVSENPAEFVEGVRQRGEASNRRAFSLDELRAVLEHCDPEWRSMVLCGLYSGHRLSDITSLTWSNIDLQRGELRLQTRQPAKRLFIPLAPPLLQHLESLPQAIIQNRRCIREPLRFSRKRDARPRSPISSFFCWLLPVYAHTLDASQLAKVGTRPGTRPLSFHSLRRTATTFLHEAGIPAAVCQALIGHDSEAIHELYVTVGREALTAAAAALPEL